MSIMCPSLIQAFVQQFLLVNFKTENRQSVVYYCESNVTYLQWFQMLL